MSTNIKLNREGRVPAFQPIPKNMVLPSISSSKPPIGIRAKSQSAQRLPTKQSLQKNSNQRSTKRIYKEAPPKEQQTAGKKIDLEGLLVNKETVLENSSNKTSSIRKKSFSIKIPMREDERWNDSTGTKDVTNPKLESLKRSSQKQMKAKQFLSKIEKLNQNLLLTIKMGKIDTQLSISKNIFANLSKIKASNEEQFHKLTASSIKQCLLSVNTTSITATQSSKVQWRSSIDLFIQLSACQSFSQQSLKNQKLQDCWTSILHLFRAQRTSISSQQNSFLLQDDILSKIQKEISLSNRQSSDNSKILENFFSDQKSMQRSLESHQCLRKMPITNTFFKNYKDQNISYDLEKRLGTIFVLLDKLENEQLSFFCIENDIVSLLKEVKKNVDYFFKNHRESKATHDQIGLLKGVVTTWLKKYEKYKSNQLESLFEQFIK